MSLSASKIYSYLLLIVIISFSTFTIININKDPRNQYELFLLDQYKSMPNYSEDELKDIPKPEHPHMAIFQNNFMTLDPKLGYVPSDRLNEAFIETRAIQNNISNERQIAWNAIGSDMGGRTRTLMFDPNDSNYLKVWAAGVSGGLWYNGNIEDIDSYWQPVSDFWDNLSVSKIIYDPNNPEIYYVATGEANTAIITYRESSSRGVGIWKSLDSGENWELLEATVNFEYVTDIEIQNNNGNSTLYASVVSGIYQGESHLSSPSDGLYRSTDFGVTWEQVLPNIINSNIPYSPSDIEITSSGKIFVGTMKNLEGNGGATILSSLTGDINTWTINSDYKILIESSNENNIPGRVILSSCKDEPNYIYATIGAGFLNNMGFNLSYGELMIKSSDSGDSWSQINIPTEDANEWASLAWHALALSVHPENPNILFAGGLELYKSIDGGNSWVDLSEWNLMYYGGGDRYIHADIHQIIFKPNDTNSIAVTSDGGLFYSNNSHLPGYEPSFIERNQGYNTLQFYTCDISSNTNELEVVGGLQDNGTLYLQANGGIIENLNINDMITGGDGAFCFFDENEPRLLTSTYYNAWYLINTETNEYDYANGSSGVFINPSDYDSQNNILYANKVRFNGSQNNRIITINENAEISTINLNTNTSVYFSSVKISPYSNNETNIFLGTQSGKLYKINDIGNTNSVNEIGSELFPTGNISSINIGYSEDQILITFSNYGVSSIWFTDNGGNTWTEKEGNLPDMPIRWALFNPNDNNFVLIATEIGVWETSNLLNNNTSWLPSNSLGNVRVDMLSIRESDNMVLAATHGRGLFYGYFENSATIQGDINSDDIINVLDVILLVNLIIDNSSYIIQADINMDSLINILDVVLLVNNILDN